MIYNTTMKKLIYKKYPPVLNIPFIFKLMEIQNLNKNRLAKKAGISRQWLHFLLTGKRYQAAKILAPALDVNEEDLIE